LIPGGFSAPDKTGNSAGEEKGRRHDDKGAFGIGRNIAIKGDALSTDRFDGGFAFGGVLR